MVVVMMITSQALKSMIMVDTLRAGIIFFF